MIHEIAKEVAFFACGGTIDKIYFDAKSSYSVGEPASDAIATRARVQLMPPAKSLLKKDSLEMDDADRAAVVAAVRECRLARVVISHGTDTMDMTARALAEDADCLAKTVVLVGSFLPAVFRESDADFNVGFAAAAALCAPPGIYVAMTGKLIPAATVKKNREAGVFEG